MTAAQILAGLLFAAVLAAGYFAHRSLIDRRDRDTITADRDAARAEVADKEQVAAYLDAALTDARGTIDQLLTERADLARANRRHYAIPTIDGNRANILDAIDTLGIGMVLDCADPVDPPIAAEARGNVVVLDSKRGRA